MKTKLLVIPIFLTLASCGGVNMLEITMLPPDVATYDREFIFAEETLRDTIYGVDIEAAREIDTVASPGKCREIKFRMDSKDGGSTSDKIILTVGFKPALNPKERITLAFAHRQGGLFIHSWDIEVTAPNDKLLQESKFTFSDTFSEPDANVGQFPWYNNDGQGGDKEIAGSYTITTKERIKLDVKMTLKLSAKTTKINRYCDNGGY